MNTQILKAFTVLSTLVSIFSCQSPSSNGPCNYTEEKFNMTIVDVIQDTNNENHYTVLVDFDGNIKYANKTQNLEEVRGVHTDFDFIINNHIKAGNIYKGVCHLKVKDSGNCEDEFFEWDNSFRK